MRAWFASLCSCLLLACAEEEAELPTEPAPEAIFGRCEELSGSTCTLEVPKTLTIWVDVHAATPLRVRADGDALPSKGKALHGGVLLSFDVPEGARSIELDSPEVRWDPAVDIDLRWQPKLDVKRKPEESLDKALERAVAENTGWLKLRALDKRRRHHDGLKSGIELGNEELALARELDAPIHQTYVLGTQALFYIRVLQDLGKARERLDELKRLNENSPLATARWQYYTGLFARRTDQLALAAKHFAAARSLYEKLGDMAALEPLEFEAVSLAELGRAKEAQARYHAAFAPDVSDSLTCEATVRRTNNFGWVELVLASGGQSLGDPRAELEDALTRLRDCENAWDETSLLLSLAMAEDLENRSEHALGWLSRINFLDAELRAWVEQVHSRASSLLGGGAPLIAKPPPTADYGLRWNQAVQKARDLQTWGLFELAAAEYQRAEDLLAESANRVGVDPSSAPYLAGRTASLRGLVDVQLTLGHHGAAACAIRLARAREIARIDRVARLGLATPDARKQWSRDMETISDQQRVIERNRAQLWSLSEVERATAQSKLEENTRTSQARLDEALRALGIEPTPTRCEDLRPPRDGEVILTVYDAHAFATHAGGVEVASLDQLGTLGALAHAQLITVVEAGERPDTPVHAMQWRDGRSLIELAPVAYSLDLAPRMPLDGGGATLIVADARSDLPGARDEAAEVRRSLESAGRDATLLEGPDASRAALVAALPTVEFFHYAGHGSRAGLSGWDSALLLADEERLGIPDVLTLDRVPHGVVLTGCETAAATPRSIGGGMNIARAFVLSGSEWVVAADTEIADRYAAEVGVAIHATGASRGPARLRDALLELRDRDPDAPWQHFRAIVP